MTDNGTPTPDQRYAIRIVLMIFVCMFIADTVMQFSGRVYKEPSYLLTIIVPVITTVVYAYYKRRAK